MWENQHKSCHLEDNNPRLILNIGNCYLINRKSYRIGELDPCYINSPRVVFFNLVGMDV